MSSHVRSTLLFTLALAVAGCGAADYEEQLKRTQSRLALLDEEDRLLGDPVTLPTGLGLSVFLRPPKSVLSAGNPTASPAPDWLGAYPWSEGKALVPPLELYVGVHPNSGQREELEASIQRELTSQGSSAQRVSETNGGRELSVTRACAPPDDRVAVRYRRFVFQDEELPVWPAPKRSVLPAPCVYRYETYLHEADDLCVVIVFKLLDREATERTWKAKGVEAAELRRLPTLDRKELAKQREACLATLRIGDAGQAARKAWKNGGGQ